MQRLRPILPSPQQQDKFWNPVKRLLAKQMTVDQVAKYFPPVTMKLDWKDLPVVKDLQQKYSQFSSCPVCLQQNHLADNNSARKPHTIKQVSNGTTRPPLPEIAQKISQEHPTHICQSCLMPTHSSEQHYQADEDNHKLLCGVIRGSVEDAVDLQSSRPKWEVNFPTAESLKITNGTSTVLNWTSWRAIFRTRGFMRPLYASNTSAASAPHKDSTKFDRYALSRRLVSSLLTYPYSVGSLIGGKPWLYYKEDDVVDGVMNYTSGNVPAVTDNGWHLFSQLSQAVDITMRTGKQKELQIVARKEQRAREMLRNLRRERYGKLYKKVSNVLTNLRYRNNADITSPDSKALVAMTTPSKVTNNLLVQQLINPAIFRIFVVGASAECYLPRGAWDQLAHTFGNNVPFWIYFIGEDVVVPNRNDQIQFVNAEGVKNMSKGEQMFSSKKHELRRSREALSYMPSTPQNDKTLVLEDGSTVTQHSVPVSENLRMIYIPKTKYTPQLHKALEQDKFRASRDIFFMFNSGIGTFEQFDTSQEFRIEGDVFETLDQKRELSIKQQQVDFVKKYNQDWVDTVDAIAKTKCLMVFSSYNMKSLQNDLSFLGKNFALTSPYIKTSSDKETQLDFAMHPVTNKFSSQRVDIPFDTLGEPEYWAQCNAYTFALRGAGTDLQPDNQDKQVEQQTTSNTWF